MPEESPTWPQAHWHQPQPSEPVRPDEPFTWVAVGLWACKRCGAGVPGDFRDIHARWHGETPQAPFTRTVHGLTTPNHDVYRLVEIESALAPALALDALRAWAMHEGADLSFREPTGFRATFNSKGLRTSVPENHGMRLGVEVRTDQAGTVATLLIVPLSYAPFPSPAGLSGPPEVPRPVLETRFDQLETAMREKVGRR